MLRGAPRAVAYSLEQGSPLFNATLFPRRVRNAASDSPRTLELHFPSGIPPSGSVFGPFRKMIRPAAVLVLRAYTGLATPLHGVLHRRSHGFEVGGGIEAGPVLTALHGDVRTVCVRAARFHAGLNDAGALQPGPLVLEGLVVEARDRSIMIGRVASGSSGAARHLITYLTADIVHCGRVHSLPFVTVPADGALVPLWDTLQPLTAGVKHGVVACAGGCFLLQRVDIPSAPPRGEALVRNLAAADLLVESLPTSRNTTLYRLARNAVLCAPSGFEQQLADLQSSLRVPPSGEAQSRLPAGASSLLLSGSLADVNGPDLSVAQLREALPSHFRLRVQPLLRWQLPTQRLVVHVEATDARGSGGTSATLHMKPWTEREEHLDISVRARHPPFVSPKPGETAATQREQLRRILHASTGKLVRRLALSASKPLLDAFAQALSATLTNSLSASALFQGPVACRSSCSFLVMRGLSARLPGGRSVVIPEYASRPDAPRLQAFLGPLMALGIKASYTPWPMALQGIAAPI